MTDGEIEQKVAKAAESLREHELAAQRCKHLETIMQQVDTELAELRERLASEQEDVDRLENLSLTRVIAALNGSRDDKLASEKADVDAANYLIADATARLDALKSEYQAADLQRARLAAAPIVYKAVLEEKERFIRASGSPAGKQLAGLAEEKGRLSAELRELNDARIAADRAVQALEEVDRLLGDAKGWSTYDTFFGGGAISSAIKHSRLDDAARAAGYADQCLAKLRTELADVGGSLTAPRVAVSNTTRFVDVWFDNIFTDLAVRDRIKQGQGNIAKSTLEVSQVRSAITRRTREAEARLSAIEAERQRLITP